MKYRRCDYYKEKNPIIQVGKKTEIYYSYPESNFDMELVDFKGELIDT